MGNTASNEEDSRYFGSSSTAEEVAHKFGDNASEKYVIVTGGNGGLGLETARVLALNGSHVTIACRSAKNGEQAVAGLLKENPDAKVTFLQLDLGSFASIRSFVEAYKATGKPLHLLINNAGVMACPKTLTAEGLEMQFGTNHVGHFLLTTLLLDLIKSSGTAESPARIVNLSSIGQYYFSPEVGIRLDDLAGEESYDAWERYGSSKLANVLFTKQLQRIFTEEKANVVAVSVHPGVIAETNLTRHIDIGSAISIASKLMPLGLSAMYSFAAGDSKNIKQGAATSVYCALAPEILTNGGAHFADCHVEAVQLHPTATDAQLAQDLWAASEAIVNRE